MHRLQKIWLPKRSVLSLLLLLLFVSCGTTRPTRQFDELERSAENIPVTKIYRGTSLEETYQAALRVLSIYTVTDSQLNESERSAIINTALITGEDHNPQLFDYPSPPAYFESIRTSLQLRFAEGPKKGATSTVIEIKKKLEIRKDFYEGWSNLQSDRYEEELILDQISEELYNDRALQRALRNPPEKKLKRKNAPPR